MQLELPLPHMLLIAALGLAGCAATQQEFEAQHWDEKTMGPIPQYTSTAIKLFSPEMMPDSGVYYEYSGQELNDELSNLPRKLRRLFVLGVPVAMAWSRPPHYPCEEEPRPGRVSFSPGFLILWLGTPNDALIRYGYQPISRPKKLPCPYWVILYQPSMDSTAVR